MTGGLIDALAKKAEQVADESTEYLAADGLKHCVICGGKRETIIKLPFPDTQEKKVKCWCNCLTEYDLLKKEEKRNAIARNRAICFKGFENLSHFTFEMDDHSGDQQIVQACKNYVKDFADNLNQGLGLLFYGKVGTGKTFLAGCISNELIDAGYRVRMTNFITVADELWNAEDKNEYVADLNRYDLLVLDDLGAERETEYMNEMVYRVVNARYTVGKPMVITTNLPTTELGQAKDIGKQRIYDRIIERCLPIMVSGKSRRRASAGARWSEMRKQLGLQEC